MITYSYAIFDFVSTEKEKELIKKLVEHFDSDRYELVEKKDWKINNLKKQISNLEKERDGWLELVEEYRSNAVKIENKRIELVKELEKE